MNSCFIVVSSPRNGTASPPEKQSVSFDMLAYTSGYI
ncbi:unnamed protein product [Brassica rapa]|uniref:Uncharacterized protein n=1 Tax=Brassica campestris TaxID=3711 RepID=A0A8D9DKG0_BRACM|nr:unnamed protein product [Brassica rapa]